MIINQADPWYIQLRDRLVTYFNESEIRSLCFDLGIDYEELAGDTKAEKAMQLVQFTARRGQAASLIARCAAQRPNLEWESLKIAAAKKPVFWGTPEPVTPIPMASTVQAGHPSWKAIARRVIAGGLLILLIIGVFGVVKALQSLSPSKQAEMVLPSAAAQLAAKMETPQAQPAAYAVTASLPGEIIRVGLRRYQVLETSAESDTADHFLLRLHVRMYNDMGYTDSLTVSSFRLLEDGVARQPVVQDAASDCNAAVGGESASDACYLVFSSSTQASDLQLKIIDDSSEAEMSLPVTFKVAAPGLIPTATPSLVPSGLFTVSASISTELVRLGMMRYQVLSLQAEPYSSAKVLLTLQVRGTNDDIGSVAFVAGSFRILEDDVPRQPDTSLTSCNLSLLAQSSSDACQLQFVVSAQAKEIILRIFNDQGAESLLPVTFAVTRP